jgi:2,4-dienoyl-CoA reductase (NADPH2)
VSVGSLFPHPLNPYGDFPLDVAKRTYDTMLSSGDHTLRNFMLMRYRVLQPIFKWMWHRVKRKTGQPMEGHNVAAARAIKQAVGVPVIVTGGLQRASLIREIIASGAADAVSMARPLVANPDLPRQLAAGRDMPERPCTFCNRCLLNLLENPFGCYEEARYDTYEDMISEIMAVYHPSPFDPVETGATRAS